MQLLRAIGIVIAIRERRMNKQLLNRREFNGLWVTLGASLSSVGTMIVALPSASARAATPTVKFPDGTVVPALGQGSANLAQGRHPEAAEEEALRTGLSLGMRLIDTAEIYSDGRSEKLIGSVIAGQRDSVFLVSKGTSPRLRQSHAEMAVRKRSREPQCYQRPGQYSGSLLGRTVCRSRDRSARIPDVHCWPGRHRFGPTTPRGRNRVVGRGAG